MHYDKTSTLVSSLFQNAAQFPDKEAFRLADEAVTFHELLEKASKLAQVLVQQGMKKGDIVCLYLNKSLQSVISIYGVLLSGAAYVSFDPATPVLQMRRILQEVRASVMITQPAYRAKIAEVVEGIHLQTVVGLQTIDQPTIRSISWEEVDAGSMLSTEHVYPNPDDLAAIFFTSGSTGIPKGIMHTHHSAVQYPFCMSRTFSIQPEDRIANLSSHHFSASIMDLFLGVLIGATTVIIPPEKVMFGSDLQAELANGKVSVLYTVPFVLNKLSDHPEIADSLACVKKVFVSGEISSAKKINQLMSYLPQTQFCNVYGSTEAFVMTYYVFPNIDLPEQARIPIGVPFDHVKVMLLHDDHTPVKQGETGNIFISSPSLLKGILNQESLFQEAIYQNGSETFFRTGDLGEQMPNGNYVLIGRNDRTIKLRGIRIDLDEIELATLTHKAVDYCAVYVSEQNPEMKMIECAVVLKRDEAVSTKELMQHLKKILPAYALPARLYLCDELPRTLTGKINRKVLQTRSKR
jgi:amino acid adenylation domain-containing protein